MAQVVVKVVMLIITEAEPKVNNKVLQRSSLRSCTCKGNGSKIKTELANKFYTLITLF